MKSSDDESLATFENSTPGLSKGQGKFRLSGAVLGPNRPGPEPPAIPNEDAEVKLTEYLA